MATKQNLPTLKNGSSGSDVKQLQNALIQAGYDVGSAGADGVYGSKTAAAVKQYQKDNGLAVDGIAGKNTLNSLYYTSDSGQKTAANNALATVAKNAVAAGVNTATGNNTQKLTAAAKNAASTVVGNAVNAGMETAKAAATNAVNNSTAKTTSSGTKAPATTTTAPAATTTPTATTTPSASQATVNVQPFTYDDFSYDKQFTYDDFTYGDFSYGAYAESDAVKQANALLQQQIAAKPGAYQSQWQDEISDYMNRIENRDPFSYDPNSDALYNMYKDNYIQQGQMAMMDTMGQAAAMTGGYGNSYAQTVGQQAYNQQLSQLNNVLPELSQMAYNRYQDEGQRLQDMYNMYLGREEQDYGRYMDSFNAWQAERDYLANRYDAERDADYSRWEADRALAYDQYTNDRSYAYDQWQSNRDLAYDQYNADRNLAYDKWSSDRELAFDQYQTNLQNAQWQAEFDEDTRRYEQNRQDSLAKSSSSGVGVGDDTPNYRKPSDAEDKYYASLFAKVQSQEELDLLAQRMEASEFSPDYVAAFYNQYTGTYGKQEPIDTGVPTLSLAELEAQRKANNRTNNTIYRLW